MRRFDRIEHLIWLHDPASVEQIQEVLCTELGVRLEAIPLRWSLCGCGKACDILKRTSANEYVACEPSSLVIRGSERLCCIGGLDYLTYLQKLQFYVFDQPLDSGEIESLWQHSEGNPQQLKHALYDLLKSDER